jgi:hypothetical protein
MRQKTRKQIGYRIYCDNCGDNSMRVSEIKENYLCSGCEKKEDKDYGKCEYCECESKLFNGKCFICIDIEEVNKGMIDFIDADKQSLICKDCNIEKASTKYIKIENNEVCLCRYCYLTRIYT